MGGLTGIGFQVSQQYRSGDLEKVVGYEIRTKPAEFRLQIQEDGGTSHGFVGACWAKEG